MNLLPFCLLVILAGGNDTQVVSNSELNFRFEIPATFEQLPASDEDVHQIHAYFQPAQTPSESPILLFVRRLRGTLNRGKITSKRQDSETFTDRWQDLDIQVVRFPETIGDEPRVTFSTLVPLVPEAIQIQMNSSPSDAQHAHDALRQILASLQGRTNWMTNEERLDSFIGATIQAVVVIGVVSFLVFRWIKSKRKVT